VVSIYLSVGYTKSPPKYVLLADFPSSPVVPPAQPKTPKPQESIYEKDGIICN